MPAALADVSNPGEPDAPPAGLASPAALPLRWLESHGDFLFAYALRRVRRRELAEDLVQETLLSGLQAVNRFRQESSAKTWLTGILRNKISEHFRARYRHERIDLLTAEDEQLFDRRGIWKVPVPRWHGDPAELAQLAEFRLVVEGCMSQTADADGAPVREPGLGG